MTGLRHNKCLSLFEATMMVIEGDKILGHLVVPS